MFVKCTAKKPKISQKKKTLILHIKRLIERNWEEGSNVSSHYLIGL
jgi:hypothetical protein